jgi:hypothetical protein
VQTACGKLHTSRSRDIDSSGAFDCDAENAILGQQLAVASSVGMSHQSVLGASKRVPQLKMRLGLRRNVGFKKPAVESHPVTASGTLSDVLQESRSTQSALDVLYSDNLSEGSYQIPSWPYMKRL